MEPTIQIYHNKKEIKQNKMIEKEYKYDFNNFRNRIDNVGSRNCFA
jgi:hypothetical protein